MSLLRTPGARNVRVRLGRCEYGSSEARNRRKQKQLAHNVDG